MVKKKSKTKKELLKEIKKLKKKSESVEKKQILGTIKEAEDIVKETKVGYARELGRMKAVKDRIGGIFKKQLKTAAVGFLIGLVLIIFGSSKSSFKMILVGIIFIIVSIGIFLKAFTERDKKLKN